MNQTQAPVQQAFSDHLKLAISKFLEPTFLEALKAHLNSVLKQALNPKDALSEALQSQSASDAIVKILWNLSLMAILLLGTMTTLLLLTGIKAAMVPLLMISLPSIILSAISGLAIAAASFWILSRIMAGSHASTRRFWVSFSHFVTLASVYGLIFILALPFVSSRTMPLSLIMVALSLGYSMAGIFVMRFILVDGMQSNPKRVTFIQAGLFVLATFAVSSTYSMSQKISQIRELSSWGDRDAFTLPAMNAEAAYHCSYEARAGYKSDAEVCMQFPRLSKHFQKAALEGYCGQGHRDVAVLEGACPVKAQTYLCRVGSDGAQAAFETFIYSSERSTAEAYCVLQQGHFVAVKE